MDSDLPETDKSPFRDMVKRAIANSTLWAFLLIAGCFVAAYLLWHDSEHNRNNNSDPIAEFIEKHATESPLLQIGPEDVTISHKWSLLSGIYPAVMFRCHFYTPSRTFSRAVFCYRPLGSPVWTTEEARLRRDNTARLTLRDLRRNIPYECFFIAENQDTIVRSRIVTFRISRRKT